MRRLLGLLALALLAVAPAAAEEPSAGLAELRHVAGAWDVRTEFLNPDGSIARAVDGDYEFQWAIPDAVLSGIARQPELNGTTAILLYLRPAAAQVEMVAVDQAGVRWMMTGADGSNVRETEDRAMSDGSVMRLRFTRYAVEPDRFESRMDYSTDGGASWTRGNRQLFVRRGS